MPRLLRLPLFQLAMACALGLYLWWSLAWWEDMPPVGTLRPQTRSGAPTRPSLALEEGAVEEVVRADGGGASTTATRKAAAQVSAVSRPTPPPHGTSKLQLNQQQQRQQQQDAQRHWLEHQQKQQRKQNHPDADEEDIPPPPRKKTRFVASPTPEPTYAPFSDPPVQEVEPSVLLHRRERILGSIRSAWDSYVTHAFGADEFNPVTNSSSSWGAGGGSKVQVQLIDALDTLWLVGLRDEFNRGVEKVVQSFRFTPTQAVSIFETTIRVTGGLLSAFALSGNRSLLLKARDVSDVFMPAYSPYHMLPAPRGFSCPYVNWNPIAKAGTFMTTVLADAGTVQLENAYLSDSLGEPSYYATVHKLYDMLGNLTDETTGLVPRYLTPESDFTVGGQADSYYEYLLKVHLYNGDAILEKMYRKAVKGIRRYLRTALPNGRAALRTGPWDKRKGIVQDRGEMEELSCFVPGMLALGVRHLDFTEEEIREQMQLAKEVTRFCMDFYRLSPTGLAPETVGYQGNTPLQIRRAEGLLRPETTESLFYMYRQTKDPIYRKWGWEIYKSLEAKGRVCPTCAVSGYSQVKDVRFASFDGIQPTWFLAETLKYMHLLMSDDDAFDLDCWVFNTEAHPIPIPCRKPKFTAEMYQKASWSV